MAKTIFKKVTLTCLTIAFVMLMSSINIFAVSYVKENPSDYYDVEIITEGITWEKLDEKWIAIVDDERIYDKWILWEDNYYLINKDGNMATGWFLSDSGESKEFTFYFVDNGKMGLYWQEINGHWYYFHMGGLSKSGIHIANSSRGANNYYFNAEGQMVAGWQKINSKWYYFDKDWGMKSDWLKWNQAWYFLGYTSGQESESIDAGEMRTGWIRTGSKWYYLNANGDMASNWVNTGGKWYYLDNQAGHMKEEWVKDGQNWYYLNKASGDMATGWIKNNGKWYYLRTQKDSTVNNIYGSMISDTSYTINGKLYRFNTLGECMNP